MDLPVIYQEGGKQGNNKSILVLGLALGIHLLTQ